MATSNPTVGAHVFDADIRVRYEQPFCMGGTQRMATVEVNARFFNKDQAHAFERAVRKLLESPCEP